METEKIKVIFNINNVKIDKALIELGMHFDFHRLPPRWACPYCGNIITAEKKPERCKTCGFPKPFSSQWDYREFKHEGPSPEVRWEE